MLINKHLALILGRGTSVATKPHQGVAAMRNIKNIFTTQIVLALVFGLLTVFAVNGNSASDTAILSKSSAKTRNLIARDLSNKLKTDLSENNLQVKLTNLEESRMSGNLVEVKGQAFCVLMKDQTELLINFEAKFNPVRQTVSDVKYVFVESAESSYAPSTQEEVLMKELMKQIGSDYKTEQITIAIDNFETLKMDNNQTGYKGIGEVKIGQMVWNKINFNVVMNDDKTSSQIKYDIAK